MPLSFCSTEWAMRGENGKNLRDIFKLIFKRPETVLAGDSCALGEACPPNSYCDQTDKVERIFKNRKYFSK